MTRNERQTIREIAEELTEALIQEFWKESNWSGRPKPKREIFKELDTAIYKSVATIKEHSTHFYNA